MKIFRIENANGNGPYQMWNEGCQVFGDGVKPEEDNHPAPDRDAYLTDWWLWTERDVRDTYYFGFASMASLHRWFYNPDWLQSMHEHGFYVAIYELERYTYWESDGHKHATENFKVGEKQAVFRREVATLIEQMPLLSLLENACA